MSVRPIVLFPDPSLKETCRAVETFSEMTQRAVTDLWDTLHHAPGVGLAAPQIGIPLRVVVVHANRYPLRPGQKPFHSHGPLALVNPRVVKTEGAQVFREGCLSIPDFLADIRRAAWVRVEALNPDGKPVAIETDGFEAVILQHEIDHLDGFLFLDRVANLKTDLFRRDRGKIKTR